MHCKLLDGLIQWDLPGGWVPGHLSIVVALRQRVCTMDSQGGDILTCNP